VKIYYTSQFATSYKKLPKSIKLEAELKEKLFRKNPFDSALKTHKLTGKLRSFWSFSVDRKYRIIFEFINKNEVVFHKTGTHDIYRK